MNEFFSKDSIRVLDVTLKIKDIERSLDFYVNKLGFKLISSDNNLYKLGVNEEVLVTLVEDKNAIAKSATTGLYHYAILLPNRKFLGQLIKHFIETKLPIVGGSDHGVSEALYLNDPDGNGIEIYSDRHSSEWEFENDEVIMGSDPLDYLDLINDSYADAWTGFPIGTKMGHVHYHVSTLDEAVVFFVDIIGLNQMLNYGGSAIFLSSHGYHHHLGMNTWAGTNVLNKPANMVGLESYHLNTGSNRDSLIKRLNEAKIDILEDELGTYIYDVNNVKVYF